MRLISMIIKLTVIFLLSMEQTKKEHSGEKHERRNIKVLRKGGRIKPLAQEIKELEAVKVKQVGEQSVRGGGGGVPTLPPGGWSWSRKGGASVCYSSPLHTSYSSCLAALRGMERQQRSAGGGGQDIATMRTNLPLDGWRWEPFLPPGWLVLTKRSTTSFLTPQLKLFESVSTAGQWMAGRLGLGQAAIEAVFAGLGKKMQRNLVFKPLAGPKAPIIENKPLVSASVNRPKVDQEVVQLEPDSPTGMDLSLTVEDCNFGKALKPTAETKTDTQKLQTKQKNKNPEKANPKKNTVGKESKLPAWSAHPLLPPGWRMRYRPWNSAKADRIHRNVQLVTEEGTVFEGFKTALEYLKLRQERRQARRLRKLQEEDRGEEGGVSLPPGWRRRIAEGGAGMEFILSPEGRQYRSRFVAIQDMIRKGSSVEEVQVMRTKLVEFEGWEENALLPEGWLFKVHWEGFVPHKNSVQSSLSFLSSEGGAFESMKTAKEFMEGQGYSGSDLSNCSEFLRARSRETIGSRFLWEADSTLPEGWRARQAGDTRFVLAPWGAQYKSRASALEHLPAQGVPLAEVELLREQMVELEGWRTSSLLPQGWIFKPNSEGDSTTVSFFTSNSKHIKGVKRVVDYMKVKPKYTSAHVHNFAKFWKELCGGAAGSKYQWIEGETVPEGWKMRRTEGGREMVMNPMGEQFRSRLMAMKNMIRNKAGTEAEVEAMRVKVVEQEGWERLAFLPEGWLAKMTWKGRARKGRRAAQQATMAYFSREGETYQSLSNVLQHVLNTPGYTELEVAGLQEHLQAKGKKKERKSLEEYAPMEITPMRDEKTISQDDLKPPFDVPRQKGVMKSGWKEESVLPEGWRTKRFRTGRWKGRQWLLAPDGTQYRSPRAAVEGVRRAAGGQEVLSSLIALAKRKIKAGQADDKTTTPSVGKDEVLEPKREEESLDDSGFVEMVEEEPAVRGNTDEATENGSGIVDKMQEFLSKMSLKMSQGFSNSDLQSEMAKFQLNLKELNNSEKL